MLWASLYAILDALFPIYLLFRPCVGVSVASLIVLGPKAWPVTALGALFAGCYLHHDWWQIGIDVVIDTCQGALAWALVNRFIGFPAPIFKTSHIISFHLLIGPVAMGVGSVLGVIAHSLCSIELPYSSAQTLLYRWLAQSFGAVLLTPILLSLFHQEYPWNRRRTSVAIPVFILLMLTFYARWLVELRVDALQTVTLSRQADQLAKELEHQLSTSASTLRATSSFFESSETVSQKELEHFVATVIQGRVAPVALAWIAQESNTQRILHSSDASTTELDAFLRQARSVRSLLDHGNGVSGPTFQAEVAHGVPENGPLYLLATPTRSFEGRQTGVVVGAFNLHTLAQNALAESLSNGDLLLEIRLLEGDRSYLLAHSGKSLDHPDQVIERYEMGGLDWSVKVSPTGPSTTTPRLGMVAGLLMASALQLFFLRLGNQTTRIEMLKSEMENRAEALRELNSDLEGAVETARQADQAKSLFLANISHEIRTPMNGILGLTRLVLDSPLRPAQKKQLRHVELSAQNLLALLSNILDAAKAQSNPSLVDIQPHHLSLLLQETSRALGLAAEEKGVELIFAIDADVPERLAVDGPKLRQVLLNLISNAIKFTPTGGEVELKVSSKSLPNDRTWLTFLVQDTGIGIADDQLEAIFLPFVQADGATDQQGSGLGLAISRALVEQMGGKLEVESIPGKGSCFSFGLECQIEPSTSSAFPDLEPSTITIHVRLRHQRHQAVVEETLTQWGFPLANESAPAKLLILEHADLAGKREDQAAVVILSVLETTQLLDSCLQRGAVPLTRPFSRHSLQQTMVQALSPSSFPDGSNRPLAYRGKLALVVDDNLTNRLLATLLLQRMGFEVDSLEDGESALRSVASRKYDLVLLDIRLPGLDGFQVASALRDRGVAIPIIAATAHAQVENPERSPAADFNAFLTKPLDEHRLRDTVADLVTPSSQVFFDADFLLHCVGGDLDSACEVIASFLQEEPELRTALFQASSSSQLAYASHTLKGAVEVFGTEMLLDRLTRLEHQAEVGKFVHGDHNWTEIEASLNDLVTGLKAFLEGTDDR